MSAAPASPLESAKASRAGLGCAVPFGLLFAAIGLVAFWFVTLRPLLRSAASADWVETPCEILSSELERHADSDGDTYRVAVRYRYQWPPPRMAVESGDAAEAATTTTPARIHESDRYDFSTGSTNVGVKRMRAAVRENPPGHRTVCYVDPAHPESAVLARDTPTGVWLGFLTLLFPGFGALFIFLAWKSARRGRADAGSPLGTASARDARAFRRGLAARDSAINSAPDASDPVPTGETLLKPAAGRIGTFIGLTLFTLFWNGILSVFVVQAAKEFGRGFIGWFLPLFLIPFVLVGLLMLGATLQAFSRLFAPAVELRLDPSLLRLGARVPFSWRLGGRGVRKLTIRLVAREEATYRQGTSTTTDRSDTHRAIVVESTDPLGLSAGRAEIVLPAEAAVPSFTANNNKLVWELVFDGEIPWRADVDDRFVLPVRGPEQAPAWGGAPEPSAHSAEGLTLWTLDHLAPGETLIFTLARDFSAKADPFVVQLGWFTEGRGTSDAAVVWSKELADLPPGADRTFEMPLPAAPWSFAGKLVSVSWRLEVLDAKRRPLVAVPLVIAPAGTLVTLPELAKERASRKWKFTARGK
jgi:hypothetical protein